MIIGDSVRFNRIRAGLMPTELAAAVGIAPEELLLIENNAGPLTTAVAASVARLNLFCQVRARAIELGYSAAWSPPALCETTADAADSSVDELAHLRDDWLAVHRAKVPDCSCCQRLAPAIVQKTAVASELPRPVEARRPPVPAPAAAPAPKPRPVVPSSKSPEPISEIEADLARFKAWHRKDKPDPRPERPLEVFQTKNR